MTDHIDSPAFPNQLYGWVRENDGTWSLYDPDGTLIIASRNGRAQVSEPNSDFEVANRKYVLEHGGPWGGASSAEFSGSGSPVGVVTPSAEGDLYVDRSTPALYQATGVSSADWQAVGGGGSQPTLRATFAHNTPNILTGVDVYTAVGGEWINNVGVLSISTAFDGTTPTLLFGINGDFATLGSYLPQISLGSADTPAGVAAQTLASSSYAVLLAPGDVVSIALSDGTYGNDPGSIVGAAKLAIPLFSLNA